MLEYMKRLYAISVNAGENTVPVGSPATPGEFPTSIQDSTAGQQIPSGLHKGAEPHTPRQKTNHRAMNTCEAKNHLAQTDTCRATSNPRQSGTHGLWTNHRESGTCGESTSHGESGNLPDSEGHGESEGHRKPQSHAGTKARRSLNIGTFSCCINVQP